MAKIAAKGGYFTLDDGTATYNLTTYLTKVGGLPGHCRRIDVTTLGASQIVYAADGLGDEAGISLDLMWDSTASGPDVALGSWTDVSTRNFEYAPEGTATTKPKYTGACYRDDYTIESTIAEVVKASASLGVVGAVTQGSY